MQMPEKNFEQRPVPGLKARLGDRLRRGVKRMRANARAGSAALEFALVAPVFFLLMFAIIETSIIYFAQASLQYAVNDVARLVRTGQAQSMSPSAFRTQICNDISPLLACSSSLQIDVESFANFSTASYPTPLDSNNNLNSSSTITSSDRPAASCSCAPSTPGA